MPDYGKVALGEVESLQEKTFKEMEIESEYVQVITDEDGLIGLGIKKDGSITVKLSPESIQNNSIPSSKLTEALQQQISVGAVAGTNAAQALSFANNPNDLVPVQPDGWRYTHGEIFVQTEISGYGWAELPKHYTSLIKGINNSGQSLTFRKKTGLVIRGRAYRGEYDPLNGGVGSITKKGDLINTTAWPPTGTFVAGDYYKYIYYQSRTIDAITLNFGDCMVYNGTAWVKQASPVQSGDGDWWVSKSTGSYDGVQYKVGERILFMGIESRATSKYKVFAKGGNSNGEYYLRGFLNPTNGYPTGPIDGDVWTIGTDGTLGEVPVKADDLLIREQGVWGVVPSDPKYVYESNAFILLPCTSGNSSEWEVRRTDKSTSSVTLKLNFYRQSARRMQSNEIIVWGDSMPGSLQTPLNAHFPGLVTVNSFGGGSSANVLTMMQREIQNNGDRYRDRVSIFWHGQNNDNNQARAVTPKLVELVGPRDSSRIILMSVLGQRIATYNGTRIVIQQQEDMKNNVAGSRQDFVNFLRNTYPEYLFDTRDALLKSASVSVPALDFPGMTEKQVADTYGIVPLSYFLSVSYNYAALVFKGYHSTAGLPTGGAANDYYVRTGVGTVGAIIVNNAGTWTEHTYDQTHLNTAGGAALGQALKTYIESKGWA